MPLISMFFFFLIVYLYLVLLGLSLLHMGFSLAAAGRSCSLVVMRGHLTAVTFLVVEHGLSRCGTCTQFPTVCEIFPEQVLNLCPLHFQANS